MMDVLKRFKVTDENVKLLEREGLDLEVLTDVTEEQLERIGVKRLGQRMKILNAAKCSDASSRACLALRVLEARIRTETEILNSVSQSPDFRVTLVTDRLLTVNG